MDLNSDQIRFLLFLSNQNSKSISKNSLSADEVQMLAFLEEKELVEFISNENRYYLAYEGFTLLESLEEVHTEVKKKEFDVINSLGGISQFNKILFIGLLVFVLSSTAINYNLSKIKNQNRRNHGLSEDQIQDIKDQIRLQMDSISVKENDQ